MPKSKDDTPNRDSLDELVRGAQRAALLKAALELDVFSRIAEGNRTLPALTRSAGWNERGTRILLDALVYAGLLSKIGIEFALTPTSETYLVKNRPAYIGNALLARMAWEPRQQLARAIRTGKPLQQFASEAYEQARAERAASEGVDSKARLAHAAALMERLEFLPDKLPGPRALGLACGSAVALLALAGLDPGTRITLVDSAPVLAAARQIAQSAGTEEQVVFQEGDPLSTVWPERSFHIAWVGGKTQYWSLEQNLGVLRGVYESLVEGGRIVVEAPISDEEHRGPGAIPLHGLDVLMTSAAGDIYTAHEYRGMLEAAGFFQVESFKDEPGLVFGRRLPPFLPPPAANGETSEPVEPAITPDS